LGLPCLRLASPGHSIVAAAQHGNTKQSQEAFTTNAHLRLHHPATLQVAFDVGHHLHFKEHDSIYTAYQHFFSIFSKDWAVRTEDPW
jgi:hypothetical protein